MAVRERRAEGRKVLQCGAESPAAVWVRGSVRAGDAAEKL